MTDRDATPAPHSPLRAALAEDMPGDFSISLDNAVRGGTERFLLEPAADAPRQSMRGFDSTFVNIVDYIVRITHRIWEQKDIGYIYDVYSHDCSVWDDFGLQYGRDKIVADTVHTNNAFPDIRLVADDIIWAGNDEIGFRTSHRAFIFGHHTGWSRYGAPTNRKVRFWCIANCVARNNEISIEHVLYNTGSLIQQLGLNLFEFARELGTQNALTAPPPDFTASEPHRLPGQGKPAMLSLNLLSDGDIDSFARAFYQNIWNRRMLGELERCCAAGVLLHAVTDREYEGLGHYRHFVLSILAMFPDLAIAVQEVYWMGNAQEGYRVSVRWSGEGTHRGYGVYGEPTGRGVHLWGISHWRIEKGLIQEEWMQFNELALLAQILGQG